MQKQDFALYNQQFLICNKIESNRTNPPTEPFKRKEYSNNGY